MLIHYVDFDTPGMLMPEGETRRVQTRIPAKLSKIPQGTYAITYFDQEEVRKGKEILEGKGKNRSVRLLFGKTYSIDEIKAMILPMLSG